MMYMCYAISNLGIALPTFHNLYNVLHETNTQSRNCVYILALMHFNVLLSHVMLVESSCMLQATQCGSIFVGEWL